MQRYRANKNRWGSGPHLQRNVLLQVAHHQLRQVVQHNAARRVELPRPRVRKAPVEDE